MFDKNNSVEEYVKKTIKDEVAKVRKEENKLSRQVVTPNQKKRNEKYEKKIQKFIKSKELEFSFEVKKQREKLPEIEEIRETIKKGEQAIEMYARSGKVAEARRLKSSLEQARYEIEMLDCVMNLDFTKPRPKAKEMASEMGIDLTDPVVIREFQKIQTDRLKEIRAIKDGKKEEYDRQKKEIEKEDFNDIFRESNRAAIDDSPEEDKQEEEEKVEESSREAAVPTREVPPRRKLEEEEDEHSFNPKTVIIWAVF